jgi:uncharacterized lipoprotein YddW (UPF0748 family)
VYQDRRSWTEEGIIDIAMPMAYKAEHTATVQPQYDQWNSWLRGHLYNRAGVLGQGAFVNAIEGTTVAGVRLLYEQLSWALAETRATAFGSPS